MAADFAVEALQLRLVVIPQGTAALFQNVQYIGHEGEQAVRVEEVEEHVL